MSPRPTPPNAAPADEGAAAMAQSLEALRTRQDEPAASGTRRLGGPALALAVLVVSGAVAVPLRGLLFDGGAPSAPAAQAEAPAPAAPALASALPVAAPVEAQEAAPAQAPVLVAAAVDAPIAEARIPDAPAAALDLALPELPAVEPATFESALARFGSLEADPPVADAVAEDLPTASPPLEPTVAEAQPALPDLAETASAPASGETRPDGRRMRTAALGQTPPVMAAPPPVPSAPPIDAPASTPQASTIETDWLIARAQGQITEGDISGARLLLERALEAGSRRAAFHLAETYDPRQLAAWRAFGIRGDPARARQLYARALEGGIADAQERLIGLR